MGILSSLFQTGAPVQQVAGPTIATQKLPEELAPYYKDILGKAQALYNERTAEGFQPYQGPTIADFTPEQQQAFTGLQGLVGSQAPVFQEGMDLTRAAAAPMTSEQMTQYMSPYQQAVTDIEKREATKQYESQVVPQLAAQAATTGGFGGSRQAILEGMAADTQQRLLSDIQAKGSQQAYQDAVQRFQADRQAAGQAGAQLATMAPQQFKAQLGEFGALQTVGEQQQRQQQTALDEAFRQYQLERNYPYDTMSRYQSVVTGAPMGTTTFAQPAPPAPSTAQTLLGGLGTLVGTYGAFGGKLPNVFGSKQGGGIADTMVYAQDGDLISRYLESLGITLPRRGDNPFPAELTGDEMEFNYGDEKKKLLDKTAQRGPDLRRLASQEGISYGPDGNIMIAGERIKPDNTFRTISQKEGMVENVADKTTKNLNTPMLKLDDPYATAYGPDGTVISKNQLVNPKTGVTIDRYGVTNKGEGGLSDLELNQMFSPVGKRQGPETISEYNARREQELKSQIPMNTLQDAEMNAMKSTQAIRDIDRRALEQTRAKEESDIAEAEKLYLEAAGKQKGKLDERAAGLTDQKNQEQWANVASFFARLGSASPTKGGILGVVDVALREAPETIEKMGNTNRRIQERKEDIENKQMDLETILRKEELGMKISGAERREKRRIQDKIEENTGKLYDLEVEKLQAEIEANLAVDDAKIADLNGVTKFLTEATGVTISNDGKIIGGTPLKGDARAELNIIIQQARTDAMTYGLAYYEKNIAPQTLAQINNLITREKTTGGGDDNEGDDKPDTSTITR